MKKSAENTFYTLGVTMTQPTVHINMKMLHSFASINKKVGVILEIGNGSSSVMPGDLFVGLPVPEEDDNEKIKTLIRALQENKDPQIRANAAYDLGSLKSKEAIPALIKALEQDDDFSVRCSSARSLGMLQSEEALPVLLKALKEDKTVAVRSAVAFSLGKLGSKDAIPKLAEALAEEGAYVIIGVNNRGTVPVRKAIVTALGDLASEEAIPVLAKALNDKDLNVRIMAVHSLGTIHSKKAIPALSTALRTDSTNVRIEAVTALGELKCEEVVADLCAALRSDEYEEIRKKAAHYLGLIKSEATIPNLIKALSDPEEGVHKESVLALSSFPSGLEKVLKYFIKTTGLKGNDVAGIQELIIVNGSNEQSAQNLLSLLKLAVLNSDQADHLTKEEKELYDILTSDENDSVAKANLLNLLSEVSGKTKDKSLQKDIADIASYFLINDPNKDVKSNAVTILDLVPLVDKETIKGFLEKALDKLESNNKNKREYGDAIRRIKLLQEDLK